MNLYEKCPACEGIGIIYKEQDNIRCGMDLVASRLGKKIDPHPLEKKTCPVCNGAGRIISEEGGALLMFLRKHIDVILPGITVEAQPLNDPS